MFQLSYTRTIEDFHHYQRLLMKRMQRALLRALPRASYYPLTIFYLFLLATMLIFLVQTDGSVVLGLATVVVGAGLYASVVIGASRRLAYLRQNGPFTGVLQLTADDRGVSTVLPSVRQQFEWSAVESVVDADSCIMLWLEPAVGEHIPDRAFSSPEQRAAFLDFARARLTSGPSSASA